MIPLRRRSPVTGTSAAPAAPAAPAARGALAARFLRTSPADADVRRSATGLRSLPRPLVALGDALREAGYSFVTVTPETHRRRLANVLGGRGAARGSGHRSLRDVFGWSLPFEAKALPEAILSLARAAGVVVERGDGLLQLRVRFSVVEGALFVHSAFPTLEADAVFLGPDTYRFCALLKRVLPPVDRLIDVGCGRGAGGLAMADRCGEVVLCDVNERALDFARVNAELAGVRASVLHSDVLASVEGPFDAVIANPPYLVDAGERQYRDGGGPHGEGLALRIVAEAAARLSPGGTLVLYTGAAIVEGVDVFRQAALPLLEAAGATVVYEELDPDVFGEELDNAAYADVDRIAAVGLVATMPAPGTLADG